MNVIFSKIFNWCNSVNLLVGLFVPRPLWVKNCLYKTKDKYIITKLSDIKKKKKIEWCNSVNFLVGLFR